VRNKISAFGGLLEWRGVVKYLTPLVAVWLIVASDGGGTAATRIGSPYDGQTTSMFAEAGAAAAELDRIRSLLVSWRGALVGERYYNGARASSPANIKSAAKSVISALVGIAIERKAIAGVRQPIADYFPSLNSPKADPRKRAITVEDLLTMRSGLQSTSNRYYGAWVQSGNWVQYALDRPLLAEPGTYMDYSTGSSHLLSAILTKATGKSTWQFAQEVLAKPLGFSLAQWPRDPQGIYFGGNDMLMTPRQMVAFGELYLKKGVVGGQPIVPAPWIEASFVPRTRSRWSDQTYGYGWWARELAGQDVRFAWGFGGQYIFVVPALDLVVVTTSSSTVDESRRSHRRTVFDIVEQLVIERIRSSADL
jgi:CubicO group peptidase (beta-lactamase class C family)